MVKNTNIKLEKNIYLFLKALDQFQYKIESIDKIWQIIFPDKKEKWHYLQLVKYQKLYYVNLIDGELPILEVLPGKHVKETSSFGSVSSRNKESFKEWDNLIKYAHAWLKYVKKDWIKANAKVCENYPLNFRIGTVPNALVRTLLSDVYRIDKSLGKAKTNKFINLVESGYFFNEKNSQRESMSANDFFEYCKIAYIAGQRKEDNVDISLSGREMYKRYADGRDEGLLDIDPKSSQEFSNWIDGIHPKKTSGGHPWEIKRGGNTTHIDLYVSRPRWQEKKGFNITLRGHAISRLKETICMFLAIYDAGFPIGIDDAEGIRKRLLAEDNIGIVPRYSSLHRANQYFREDQSVDDVLHFDDLGRHKRRIKPFISWEALPVLRPKN